MRKIALNRSRSSRERFYLVEDGRGMGGCGEPQGHYAHRWVVVNGTDRGRGYQGYYSVDYALEVLPPEACAIIRKTLKIEV